MANKKQPVPARRKKPEPAQKNKPAPARSVKSGAAKKKQPASVRGKTVTVKKQPDPAREKKPEPPVPKAQISPKELLRRCLIVILAIVTAFGVSLSVVSLRNERLQNKITLIYSGVLEDDYVFPIEFSDEQVRESVKQTRRHGQTRAFTYFCDDHLRLDPIDRYGFIMFGNPEENDCQLVLSILDEDGKLVYRSKGVEPGNYITQIRPYVQLEAGSYAYTAYVSAYVREDYRYKCVGVQYSRLTVEVGEME